jgi:hypothetical protein
MRTILNGVVALCLVGLFVEAKADLQLQFLGQCELDAKFQFEGTQVGGLSGAVYDPALSKWFVVSDDRGKKGDPRIYEMSFAASGKDLKAAHRFQCSVKAVHRIHKKAESRWSSWILDMEGIAILPWGNFLVSTEGDLGQRPRQDSRLLDIKSDGTWVRDFEFPTDYRVEKTGIQKKGNSNNFGPEGLTATADGKKIWAAFEAPLVQDAKAKKNFSRWVQFEMLEAWVIRSTAEFLYPLEGKNEGELFSVRGVSELFWLRDRHILVIERGLQVGLDGVKHSVQVYQVELPELNKAGVTPELKKTLVLDLGRLGRPVPNIEGAAWGPEIDGQKTVVLVSDNNFMSGVASEFWFFRLAL